MAVFILLVLFVSYCFCNSKASDINKIESNAIQHTTRFPPWYYYEYEYDYDECVYPDCDKDFSHYLNYTDLPDEDDTKQFILKHSSEVQRTILANQLAYCPYTPLCSHSLAEYWASTDRYRPCCAETCRCDEACKESNTCCPDMVEDVSRVDPIVPDEKECIALHLNPAAYTSTEFLELQMHGIRRCPVGSTYKDRHKCDQGYFRSDIRFHDILPVMDVADRTVYRNVHCALCNGVGVDGVKFSQPKISCKEQDMVSVKSESEIIHQVLSSLDCNIVFLFDSLRENEKRLCGGLISSCNMTGRWRTYDVMIENACKLYYSPISMADYITYRNVFCAMCNGVTSKNITYDCKYSWDYRNLDFTFSALLSYTGAGASSDKNRCDPNFLFNKHDEKCVRVYCSQLRRLTGTDCVNIIQKVDDFYYEVTMKLKPVETLTVKKAVKYAELIFGSLEHYIVDVLLVNISEEQTTHLCLTDILLKTDTECLKDIDPVTLRASLSKDLYVRLNLYIDTSHNPEELLNKLTRTHMLNVRTEDDSYLVFRVDFINELNQDFDHVSELGSKDGNYSRNISLEYFCGNSGFILVNLYGNFISVCQSNDAQLTPLKSLLTCSMVKLFKENISWAISERGLMFIDIKMSVSHEHFYHNSNETFVSLCFDNYIELSERLYGHIIIVSTDFIVSSVCVGLSVLCLIFTLVVFILLKPLRNLPGLNTMALTCSMLLAQTLYLLSSYSPLYISTFSLPCKIIGVFTHFLWLLTVCWMNVCTLHVFRTLTRTRVATFAGFTRYIMYHFYCSLVSVFFVTVNIVISYVSSGTQSIGYGDDVCYISSEKMTIYTFGIPVGFVIISNLVMFVIVIIKIKSVSGVKKSVKNDRNDIIIFAKLSTLTGLTWIFGFVNVWTGSPVFSYIFIVLNAGQGVFLMLSFVCNKRVLALFKAKQGVETASTGVPMKMKSVSGTTTSERN